MRISDWSSDVCSSDLGQRGRDGQRQQARGGSHGVTPQSGKENARSMGALRSWLRPPWAVLRCWDGIGRCGRCRKVCGRRARLMLVVSQDDPADFALAAPLQRRLPGRSEEHTSELQSLMRISYAVFCLKKNNKS